MNEDQFNRAKSAITEEMEVEHIDGSEYRVKDKYVVDVHARTCECPDNQYRDNVCKHLSRTQLEILWQTVPEPGDSSVDVPDPLTPIYDNVPAELTAMEQWVCWDYQRDDVDSHAKDWTKVPISVHGGFGSSTDSDTWTDFDEAVDYDADTYDSTDGIGIVVSKNDDLIGIDIDDCRDPDSGEVVDEVQDLIDQTGSYTEVSPSGTGLRTFVFAEDGWPVGANQTDEIGGDGVELEVYEWGRYLTVTGYHVEGTPESVTDDDDTVELFADVMRREIA